MRSAALGLASGLAIIAKFSMLLVVPLLVALLVAFFAVLLWRAPRPRRLTLAAHALCAAAAMLFVINAAYFFKGRPLLGSDARWLAEVFPADAESVMRAARALSHLLPTDFVLGVLWQMQHNGSGHPASLLGKPHRLVVLLLGRLRTQDHAPLPDPLHRRARMERARIVEAA